MRNRKLKEKFNQVNIKIKKNWAWEKYGEQNGRARYLVHNGFNTSLADFKDFICNTNVERPYAEHCRYQNMLDELENNEIPFLVYPVYHYFVSRNKFPTLEEATNEYLLLYCDEIGNGLYQFKECFEISKNPQFTSHDILSRMFRSYFSFVREVYLLFSLMQYDDIDVEYDFHVDTRQGLDIVVTCNGEKVYIASYVGTTRSIQWKSRKNIYKHASDYDGKLIIDAPAFRDGINANCTAIGQAYVYSAAEVQRIHDEILKLALNDERVLGVV